MVIDALLGTGLTKELHGFMEELVGFLNSLNVQRVAVDIPTGLMGDAPSTGAIFQIHYTFSFEQPKLAFLFPENQKYVGEWIVETIQLSEEYYDKENTYNYLLTDAVAFSHYKKRSKFEHKGSFGNALLIVGSNGKISTAVLSTLASLRAGCGLTTVYAPSCGYNILQTSVPEAMVLGDKNDAYITNIPETDKYNAIGIECELGMEKETQKVLSEIVQNVKQPQVLHADTLNCIGLNPILLNNIPRLHLNAPT